MGRDCHTMWIPLPSDQQTLMAGRPAPACARLKDASKAVYEAGLVAEILLDMAHADINGTRPVQGPSVEYLARQLRAALEIIDSALAACSEPPRGDTGA